MDQDPNEVLKEIAAMQGTPLADELEQEQEVSDEQRQEEREQEEQADDQRVQEVVEEEEEDEALETRYARLLEAHNTQAAQLLELQSRGYPISRPPEAAQVTTQPVVVPSSPPQASPQVPTFALDERLLEKALVEDDPTAMKQVIVGLVGHVENLVAQMRDTTREAILRDIPNVANSVARQQFQAMRAIEQFYLDNKDLAPYPNVVAAVANEIAAKNPQFTAAQAFDATAGEVRRRLGLKKVATIPQGRKPAFPGRGSGSRKPGAPVLSGIRGDIAKMQNARP